MKIIDYFNEPIIRKHMFGIFQTIIGMGIGIYFMFSVDGILPVCLLGFMILLFLLGNSNISETNQVIAISAALTYIIMKQKENKTEWEEKNIEKFEETDTYRLLRENGIEIDKIKFK